MKNQGNINDRIEEEKHLDKVVKYRTKYILNLEPLEIPDVRTSVGVDVGVNVGVHVGDTPSPE